MEFPTQDLCPCARTLICQCSIKFLISSFSALPLFCVCVWMFEYIIRIFFEGVHWIIKKGKLNRDGWLAGSWIGKEEQFFKQERGEQSKLNHEQSVCSRREVPSRSLHWSRPLSDLGVHHPVPFAAKKRKKNAKTL